MFCTHKEKGMIDEISNRLKGKCSWKDAGAAHNTVMLQSAIELIEVAIKRILRIRKDSWWNDGM